MIVDQYGISKLDLKRRNRMQILKLLQQQGPTSRIDISDALDLTRAAVTIITNEMIAQGVLYEKGEVNFIGQKASRGRKKVLIDINLNFQFAFGIAIDRKQVWIGLSNIGGETLEKRCFEILSNEDKDATLQQIFSHMQEMMTNNCLEKDQLMGIGICLGEWAIRFLELRTENGVVDYDPFSQLFLKGFGLPAVYDSMINGLAIAQTDLLDQSPMVEPTILVRFTDQIEATMMVENEIFQGAHHQAMDFSHLIVQPNGKPCHCGKQGCLTAECSESSLYVDIVNLFSEDKTPILFDRMGGNPNLLRVADIAEYIALGDQAVLALFDERMKSFGVFLNNLIAITDPGRILFLGGQFQDEGFFAKLKEYVTNSFGVQAGESIAVSRLKQENLYLSGCALAIRHFFIQKGGLHRT